MEKYIPVSLCIPLESKLAISLKTKYSCTNKICNIYDTKRSKKYDFSSSNNRKHMLIHEESSSVIVPAGDSSDTCHVRLCSQFLTY